MDSEIFGKRDSNHESKAKLCKIPNCPGVLSGIASSEAEVRNVEDDEDAFGNDYCRDVFPLSMVNWNASWILS